MPDKRISELTVATTPLLGNEIVPLVKSGVTSRTTVTDFTAGRTVTALNFSVTGETSIVNGLGLAPTNNVALYTNGVARLKIDQSGNTVMTGDFQIAGKIGIGVAPISGAQIYLNKPLTGNVNSYAIYNLANIQPDVTAVASAYTSVMGLAATANPAAIRTFQAIQGTFSGTTNIQTGFWADASLAGGVSNVGFYGNLAGVANRWNFYAGGLANNAYAGNSSFGKVSVPTCAVDGTSHAFNLVTNTAATYTVLATDSTIIQTTAASVYTLPNAVNFPGRKLHLVTQFAGTVTSVSSNVVPLAGGSAGAAILAATAGKFATLQSNGANWVIIAAN